MLMTIPEHTAVELLHFIEKHACCHVVEDLVAEALESFPGEEAVHIVQAHSTSTPFAAVNVCDKVPKDHDAYDAVSQLCDHLMVLCDTEKDYPEVSLHE